MRASLAFAAFPSLLLSFGLAAAQGNTPSTHGIPVPEKVYGDGKTVPLKVLTRNYDQKAILASSRVPEEVQSGRILWIQKCAYCHDGLGAPTYKTMGPWLDADNLKTFGEKNVRDFINTGDLRMPGFRYQLNDKQVDNLIAFMKSVPASEKPTAAQLAGRAAGGGGND